MNWIIEYDNDLNAEGELYEEWWDVTDGDVSFRCSKSEQAEWLRDKLSTPSNPSPVTAEAYWKNNCVFNNDPLHPEMVLTRDKFIAFASSVQQTGYGESDCISRVNAMCIESLSPEHFANWESIKKQLKNKSSLTNKPTDDESART